LRSSLNEGAVRRAVKVRKWAVEWAVKSGHRPLLLKNIKGGGRLRFKKKKCNPYFFIYPYLHYHKQANAQTDFDFTINKRSF
jgi:hypothetical protein